MDKLLLFCAAPMLLGTQVSPQNVTTSPRTTEGQNPTGNAITVGVLNPTGNSFATEGPTSTGN